MGINQARDQADLEAAAKVRKLHIGAFDFSPEIQKLILETILWS
jgi:hypothetical protein